jgi:molybdenum-dependent DNA-binding transcriptional regulator ModE
MTRVYNIGPETEDKLLMYFSGELDRKIELFEYKKNSKWPDEYYSTLNSVSYVNTRSDSNYIADSTGARATKLAFLSNCKDKYYSYYKQLKETITDIIQGLNEGDIHLIKAKLNIVEGGITEASKKTNYSYNKACKKSKELIKMLDRKI